MKKYATLEHMKLVSVKRIRRPYMDHDNNIKKLNYDEIQVLKEKMKVFLNLD